MSTRNERRKHQRFKVNGNVLVCCRLHFPKVAEVIDVSSAGMAFSYVGKPSPSGERLELDIVFPDGTDYLSKVPCKTISDVDIGKGMRRSSAEFEALSEDLGAKLNFFIQNYCTLVHDS